MTRRMLNLLTALSLLMCAAVCVLWVRSYFRLDELRLGTADGRLVRLCSYDGRLAFLSVAGLPHGEPTRWRSAPRETGRGYSPEMPRFAGFSAAAGDRVTTTWNSDGVGQGYARCRITYSAEGGPPPVGKWYSGTSDEVTPTRVTLRWRTTKHWTLTWALLVPPALWLAEAGTRHAARHWRANRRHAAGLCLSCGYDLAGNESGVCPECGNVTAASPSASPPTGPTPTDPARTAANPPARSG